MYDVYVFWLYTMYDHCDQDFIILDNFLKVLPKIHDLHLCLVKGCTKECVEFIVIKKCLLKKRRWVMNQFENNYDQANDHIN